MAKAYKTPGVYVEEISIFPPSVAPVATAIPAFIGYTAIAEKNGKGLNDTPTRITSLLEYEKYFGKAQNEENIAVTIADSVNSSDTSTVLDRKISVNMGSTSPFLMYYAMRHYFDNGGGPCYVVSVGTFPSATSVSNTDLEGGITALEKYDEPTLFVLPDAISMTGGSAMANYYTLINQALQQSQKLGDRFVIIDAFGDTASNVRDATTLGNGVDLLKYGAAYHPFLRTTYQYSYADADVDITHTVTDESDASSDGSLNGSTLNTLADSTSGNFDLILYNEIKNKVAEQTVTLAPSGAMAGIYARVDNRRGVWKAPANESVAGVLETTKIVTHEEQMTLNIHGSGKSINAIRPFAGKGIMVWGARTLAGNDNEWRYVSVRRFFNFVEESVVEATEQFVFEPNDANTWIKVRAMIENFLTLQWRAGALAGAKPDEAFFVRVGLGETMTAEDVLNGFMNVEIGMAVVRPAEFIILKFSHKMQES